MFGVGGSEIAVILLIALLLFGPSKIPEVARWLARLWREVTRLRTQVDETLSELRDEIDLNLDLPDLRQELARPALHPPSGVRQPQPQSAPLPVAQHDDYLGAPLDNGPDNYLSLQAAPPPSVDNQLIEADYAAQATRQSDASAPQAQQDAPADADPGVRQ